MAECEICGEEVKECHKCKECGTLFCENCGDPAEEVCEFCMEEEDL